MTFTIDQPYLIETLTRLVQINSCNPSLTAGSPGEAEIAAVIAGQLRDLGLQVQTHEIEAGRANVAGILRGQGGGPSLMLNAHSDTVGVAGMNNPFSAEIRDGKMFGRGTQDMKGSIAAMLAAAKAITEAGLKLGGDLLITVVADEEYTSIGAEDLVKHYQADAVIVTEPTDLQICRAHRGFIWYEIETLGRAAHGSRYQDGIDANIRMGRFLSKLDHLEQDLRHRTPHDLAGPPSLHAATLHGGGELSVYADRCVLQIERRTMPGKTEAQARAELQAIIDELTQADPTFKATLRHLFHREPFFVAADAPLVHVLDRVVGRHMGERSPHSGATFWTDAGIFAHAGMDTVLIGPIGQGLHSAEEWVELQSVVDLATILAQTAIEFCGEA